MNARIDTDTTSELHLNVPLNGYSVSLSLIYDKQEKAYTFEAIYRVPSDAEDTVAMSKDVIFYMYRRSRTAPDFENSLISLRNQHNEVTLSIKDTEQQDLIREWLSAN